MIPVEEIEAHLKRRLLPASLAHTVATVVGLLEFSGWDAANDVVPIPEGCPPFESEVRTAGGGRGLRVVDAVKALGLLELLPERLAWVGRHPSWQGVSRAGGGSPAEPAGRPWPTAP